MGRWLGEAEGRRLHTCPLGTSVLYSEQANARAVLVTPSGAAPQLWIGESRCNLSLSHPMLPCVPAAVAAWSIPVVAMSVPIMGCALRWWIVSGPRFTRQILAGSGRRAQPSADMVRFPETVGGPMLSPIVSLGSCTSAPSLREWQCCITVTIVCVFGPIISSSEPLRTTSLTCWLKVAKPPGTATGRVSTRNGCRAVISIPQRPVQITSVEVKQTHQPNLPPMLSV